MTKYTTTQGDMWDVIAKKAYDSEAGMNTLLEANTAYRETVVFPAGIVLSIPEWEAPKTELLPPWRR